MHFAKRDVRMLEKAHFESGVVTDDARALERSEHIGAGAIDIYDENLSAAVIGLHQSYAGPPRIEPRSLGKLD